MVRIDRLPQPRLTRREFLKTAGYAAAGSLLLSASCKKMLTTTAIITTTSITTASTPPTTPPASVRLPPANGLEYLVNADPSTVDNTKLPVTPPELQHVLNPSPQVNIDTYRLTIRGLVDNPLSLTYSDLQQFSMFDRTELLICPTVFADNPSLEGFSISSLMSTAITKPGAIQLVFRSLDNIQQNVAFSDALGGEMFMALKVAGEALSQEHGFPVRLVRPGQIGVFWLKCISEIEVV